MVFTNKISLRDEILVRRNQGEAKGEKYKHVRLGTNARMNDLQAAIGLVQLRKLPRFLKERKMIAQRYDQLFASKKDRISVAATKHKDSSNAYFFYPVLVENRDGMARALLEKYGIDTRIAYPMPVYEQKAYASGDLKFRKTKCPVAEEITSKILNLPIFPGMSEDMVDYVGKTILKNV